MAAVLIVGLVGFVGYYIGSQNNIKGLPTSPTQNGQIACTMEAKICPDGSSVGRQGPNCEFAACPNSGTAKLQEYKSKYGIFTLKYPSTYVVTPINVNDNSYSIEHLSFKSVEPQLISEFTIKVTKFAKELPKLPFDQDPTGTYTVDGIKGIYVSLPQGYQDAGDPNGTTPFLVLYFLNFDKLYKIHFSGESSINNPQVQAILKGLTFAKENL